MVVLATLVMRNDPENVNHHENFIVEEFLAYIASICVWHVSLIDDLGNE